MPKVGGTYSEGPGGCKVKTSERSIDPRNRPWCNVEAERTSAGQSWTCELSQQGAILVNSECDHHTAGNRVALWVFGSRKFVIETDAARTTVGAGFAVVSEVSGWRAFAISAETVDVGVAPVPTQAAVPSHEFHRYLFANL